MASSTAASSEANDYIRDKKIEPLMEGLLHDLLLNLPDDPLAYLLEALATNAVPKLIVYGPPACGKGEQCKRIAAHTGVIHISTGDLLRAEVAKGSELGQNAKQFMDRGALVPDSLITDLLKKRLSEPDVKAKGWLLDGFPRTRAQAISLQIGGVIPNLFINIDVSDVVCQQRVAGRVVDAATGITYNLTTNPPPPGITTATRSDDGVEDHKRRLAIHRRNEPEVLSCYPGAARISGERTADEIFEDVRAAIDAKVVVS